MRKLAWGMAVGALLGGVGLASAGEDVGRPRRIALVVGVSSYARVPELSLESARLDASRVASALQSGFGYDQVRLLTDASATYDAVQSIFEDQLSKEVQWRDLFMFYYVGQGLGGDFGDPRLLLYDSDLDDLDHTALSVNDLAGWMQKWIPATRYAVVTDATWGGVVRGQALVGPSGADWPTIGTQSFILSSSAPRQPAFQGVFAKAFLDGLGGRADTNADGVISGGELNTFLVSVVPNLTEGRQTPTVNAHYDPSIELAAIPKAGAGRIDRAKFVFVSGTDQKVQCTGGAALACDASCYVVDAPIGACQVSLMAGTSRLTGEVNLLRRGVYTCAAENAAVRCTGP